MTLGERRVGRLQRFEPAVDIGHQRLIEAGPHVARPDQVVVLVDAENQGAEEIPLPMRVTANHAFVLAHGFYLDPAIAAPGLIPAVAALGDDAFQFLLARSLE